MVRWHPAPLGVQAKNLAHRTSRLVCAETVYVGVEDAALFKSRDAGRVAGFSGLRRHGTGPAWQPGAGGMCLHSIILDPINPARCTSPFLPPVPFAPDDAGESWRPINRGLIS